MDRVAIVTGASRGIGLATARLLLRRGEKVVAVSRPSKGFHDALDELHAEGFKPVGLEVDVGDPAAVARAVHAALALGQLRLLVNCAGAIAIEPVERTEPETWEQILRTNLTGAFLFARSVIPQMRASGGGAIVNVASIAGTLGAGFSAAYGASKAALISFSQALAAELIGANIRVCVISPGLIDTAMGREVLDRFGALFGIDTSAYLAHVQGRWGTPEEVAELIAWLGSDAASAVSGAHIIADLGQTARLV